MFRFGGVLLHWCQNQFFLHLHPAPAPQPPREPVRPLSSGRFEFRFTGDDETEALLREARELLSHSRPEIAAIFKRGLQLVVAEARKQRFAATDRPRPGQGLAPGSREIPADVQRAVWNRDGGQCSFVGLTGWRCDERRYLEYHHLTPWIVGGAPSVVNVALRCRAHNQYEAKVYFAPIREAMANGRAVNGREDERPDRPRRRDSATIAS